MHTQSDTAQVIVGRGADYVMTVKASMPALYKQLNKLPRCAAWPSACSAWTAMPASPPPAITTPATRSGR